MDLTKETDATKLKALAYEQVVALETAQTNLRALQARMQQLEQDNVKPVTETKK